MSLSKLAEVYTDKVINENKDLTSGQTAPGKKLSGDYLEGDKKEGHGGVEDVKDLKKPETRKEKEDPNPKILKASFDPFDDLYNKILANEDFGNWEVAENELNGSDSSGGDQDTTLSFGGEDEQEMGDELDDEDGEIELGGLDAVISHLQKAVEALQALNDSSAEEDGEGGEDEDSEDGDVEDEVEEEGMEGMEEEGMEGSDEEPVEEEKEEKEEEEEEEEKVEESCETTIIGHALTTGLKKLHGDFSNPKANKPNFGLPKPAGAAKVTPGTKAHELKVLVKDIGKKAIFNKLQKGHKVDKTAGSTGYDKVGSNYGYGSGSK